MPKGVPAQEASNNVTLTQKERDILNRLISWFPPGVLNPSRVARMCIAAGAPLVEQQLKERAEQYVASGQQVPDSKADTP